MRGLWGANGINGLPAVQFNGTQWMDIAGQVITGQQFTVFAVISDTGPGSGGREVFSDFASRGDAHAWLCVGFGGIGALLAAPGLPYLAVGGLHVLREFWGVHQG
jgi:hypothetical protein